VRWQRLPFSASEREFLYRILDTGEIIPSLLTADEEMSRRILSHPGLQWKALSVRELKGSHKARRWLVAGDYRIVPTLFI
jgi:hypothetical protein